MVLRFLCKDMLDAFQKKNADLRWIKLYLKQNIIYSWTIRWWMMWEGILIIIIIIIRLLWVSCSLFGHMKNYKKHNRWICHAPLVNTWFSLPPGTHAGHLNSPFLSFSSETLFLFSSYFHNFQHEDFQCHFMELAQITLAIAKTYFSPPTMRTEYLHQPSIH